MTDRPQPVSRRTALAHMGVVMAAGALPLPRIAPRRSARAALDDDFDVLLRRASVPSFALAQVDGDRLTTRASGLCRSGDTAPATADTVYAAASLTKTVFSYVFLGLVADGIVDLDKPVREYLPLTNADDPRAGAITARRLLSHSGGWRNWRFNATQQLTSDFEPGSRWSYSGEGFVFLSRIAEKLTGKSFGRLARERVFEPLGMHRSSMVPLAELEPFLAAPHSGRGDPLVPFGRSVQLELRRILAARNASLEDATYDDALQALRVDSSIPPLPVSINPNAAASMLTTANDFGAFLRHLVTARRRGGRPAAIVELMMTPQVRCNDAVQWGLGVGLDDMGSRRFAWQWGDNQGFKHIYFAEPREEKAIVVFTNGERGPRVYERIVRALTGDDHPAFLWA